jgi:hypothetical protein
MKGAARWTIRAMFLPFHPRMLEAAFSPVLNAIADDVNADLRPKSVPSLAVSSYG